MVEKGRRRGKDGRQKKGGRGFTMWPLVAIGIILILIIVCGVCMTPCQQQQEILVVEEPFCSSCSQPGTRTEDELSTYEFTPCKCFGPQGGAINAPRPFNSSSCSDATSMTKKKMIETQGGCLRNSFDFGGGKNIGGVS